MPASPQHCLRRFLPKLLVTIFFAVGLSLYAQQSPSTSSEPTITIASFNLRVFGRHKASEPEVMTILADIVRRYDLVAVQEIRDASGTAITELLDLIDADGSAYKIVLGDRLGRTSSKEQYAFIYNSDKFQVIGQPYTYDDDNDGGTVNSVDDTGKNDLFQREPFLAYFKTVQGDFDFVIGDIHTQPSDATREISYLPMVIADASKHYGESDVLMVGDFNGDGSYFNENTYSTDFPPGKYIWIIGNAIDTTVAKSDNTYDRMAGTETMVQDFDGKSGTLRFDEAYNLKSVGLKPLDISDHYPVWAQFYVDRDTD